MLKELLTIPVCSILAPVMIFTERWPRLSYNLKVNQIKEHPAQTITVYNVPYSYPKRKVISIQDGNNKVNLWIDLDTYTFTNATKMYWRPTGGGSGDIGVLLLGLPGVILSLPVLVLNHLVWKIFEQFTDFENHDQLFYNAIKDKLDNTTRYQLFSTLQNYNA